MSFSVPLTLPSLFHCLYTPTLPHINTISAMSTHFCIAHTRRLFAAGKVLNRKCGY